MRGATRLDDRRGRRAGTPRVAERRRRRARPLRRAARGVAGRGRRGRRAGLAPGAAGHLRATFGSGTRQVLLLGHFDTVWPIGTLAQMPVAIRDGRLHGPGTFDMKAGLAIAISRREWRGRTCATFAVRCLFTTDEEIGSALRAALIEAEARASRRRAGLRAGVAGRRAEDRAQGRRHLSADVRGVSAHAGIARSWVRRRSPNSPGRSAPCDASPGARTRHHDQPASSREGRARTSSPSMREPRSTSA